ncbi:hypothetical protein CBR_g13048 [Chara braunii]|uniref:Uncharacterized protein n=1 Tax=Chara braunii TaxID=69332 RepID=A0A388KTK9_CHABU|nr:hypothetical protein CBR_g13048 [Chara braunii]|eukprot:GBG73328.1 hypothetical protein CBR_g13048 [Chara braunii]
MRTQPVLSDALKRWIEVIEQYDFDPQYLKGEYNKVVDALSRRPDFSGALITEFDLTDDVTRSLVDAYREDQFMSEIIRRLEAKDKKTSAEFELVNGLLFLEKARNKRLCVPNRGSLRSLFLGECHDVTSHFGYKKTAANLLQRFWWPTIMRDVQLYEQKMQQAVDQMQKAQAAMIESENRHRRPSTFQVGDRVWVKSSELGQEYGISRKLMPQYFGPWEVLDIVGTDPDGPSYVIRIPGHLRTYPVFHASKLAPFKETDQFPSRHSMLLPTMDGEVDIDDIVAPGTLEFAYRYEQKMQQAVEQMQKAQAAMIESENRHRRPSAFQVGDRVWVKSSKLGQEYGISRKLMPQYFGPWEVLDMVGTDPDGPSYVIRIPGHLRTYLVLHASKLAPFKETDQFPSRRSMLPPTMDGGVDIDDIVDHRELPVSRPAGRGRPPKPKLQYRVQFRHHTDPKEDRWFTREELMQTAPQVVTQYERSLQKGKRPMIED